MSADESFLKLGQVLIPKISGMNPDEVLGQILRVLPTNNYGDPVVVRSASDVEVFILIMLLMDDERIEDNYLTDAPEKWDEIQINEAVNKVQFTRIVQKLTPRNTAVLFRNIYSTGGVFDYRLQLLHYQYTMQTHKKQHNESRQNALDRYLFVGTYRQDSMFQLFSYLKNRLTA